ncbi:MAG: 4Fe-4S ferredoxin [Candidatus Thorarchaeota archaeon]|nr:MAG: 4Fe-4S ferredoxin [Candidatus Thorarchaeota archaeon]
MPTNPYERLAAILDKIPNGFVHTKSGAHLRLLKWIFTPEEADLASRMKLKGETASEIAVRLKLNEKDLKNRLEKMAEKGLIRAWTSSTGRRYALMPFAVGVYEEQLGRMDKTFARLIEDYYMDARGSGLWEAEPPIFRVIPVNKAVHSELEIFPYEVAEEMIETSKAWGVRQCICKKQQGLLGKPCKYPSTVCIVLSPKKENAFDEDHLTKAVTKDEALQILHKAEEAGLVHCSQNMQKGHFYICNCCTCCCGILRAVAQWELPYALVKSDYVATVDPELCAGCATCEDRCQFDALKVVDDVCHVDATRCIGCGVCSVTCPQSALTLTMRDPAKRKVPPETLMDWMVEKAKSRGVNPSDLL